MRTTGTDLGELAAGAAALAEAPNPSEVFRLLLEGSAAGAARVAIFLVRLGRLRGWGSRGYAAASRARLRELSLEPSAVWLGRALGSAAGEVLTKDPDEPGPDFDQPLAVESVALAVRVRERALAVVMAERSDEDPPLEPAALKLLVTIARLKLELDLSRRRDSAPTPTKNVKREPLDVAAGMETSPPANHSSLAPVEERPAAHPDDARRREAKTFARLVATDIRLYNEEAVVLGRRHRDLECRLGDHLERGRDSFRRRFPDLGEAGLALLRDAYVQVLGAGDASLFT
jgi:hypothetical protein